MSESERKLIEEKQQTKNKEKIISFGPIIFSLKDLFDFVVYIVSLVFLLYSYRIFSPSIVILDPVTLSFWNSIKKLDHHIKHIFISAFFPIAEGPMRHPLWLYKKRAVTLFNTFTRQETLYVYTSEIGKKFLLLKNKLNYTEFLNKPPKDLQFRTVGPNIKFITKYQNAFEIPKIAKYRSKYKEIADRMMRSVKYPISTEIGAIWNSKIAIIQEVMETYDPQADMVFWVDIGLIKNDEFFNKSLPYVWPSPKRLEKIFSESDLKDRIILTTRKQCVKLTSRSLYSFNINDLEFAYAGLFGGHKEAFKNFLDEYWTYHDIFLKKNQFVLREEKVFSVYSLFNPEKVFFFNMKQCNCYDYINSLAFTSQYNLCNCSNLVNKLDIDGNKACLHQLYLDSWL